VRLEGEECGENGDCVSDTECSAGNRCVSTRGTLGDRCGYYECEPPYVCDLSVTNTCVLPKADGEACSYDEVCASDSCSWSLQICTSELCF
jgi:hypothetical protein